MSLEVSTLSQHLPSEDKTGDTTFFKKNLECVQECAMCLAALLMRGWMLGEAELRLGAPLLLQNTSRSGGHRKYMVSDNMGSSCTSGCVSSIAEMETLRQDLSFKSNIFSKKKKALAVDGLIINTLLWVFKRRFTVSLQEMKMFSTLQKERTHACFS